MKPGTQMMTSQGLPFPLRALLERMNANESPPWGTHLNPDCLRAERSARKQIAQDPLEDLPRLLGASRWQVPAPTKACGISSSHSTEVVGRVWELSQDPAGCREIQKAFDCATDELKLALALELQGHVLEAMKCPHANHVLQKCITLLRPHHLQFVVNEIMACPDAIQLAARHKFGCRIMQRLLEHGLPDQVRDLGDALLDQVVDIARHPYGNYVLQNLLENGNAVQKQKLIVELREDVAITCMDSFGCKVVAAALSHSANRDDVVHLAEQIAKEPGLLVTMAHSRHGHAAVQLVIQALEGADRRAAEAQLTAELAALRVSRHGRIVAAWLCANQNDDIGMTA